MRLVFIFYGYKDKTKLQECEKKSFLQKINVKNIDYS